MNNIGEQGNQQSISNGHRSLKFPMSIPKYDKDLLEIFNLLEKGERSFFARSMIRKGINYCIENGIDIFENTSLSRGNPLLTKQVQQHASSPVGNNPLERRDVQHSIPINEPQSQPVKTFPEIIREESSNIGSQDNFDLDTMMLHHAEEKK